MPCTDGPTANKLLAALPAEDIARWRNELERVDLRPGQVLFGSGQQQSHIYFPTTAVVSLLYGTEDGHSAEIAVIGNEGLVGIAVFMGGEKTSYQAVVQSAGVGYRMLAQTIKDQIARSALVLPLLLRYTQAELTQMAQTAVCNRHHSLDQRLCRWLLWNLDRVRGSELTMTQEMMAHRLGVRREGVTEAALKLQRAGLINYVRGKIEVLDRRGLELRACECYSVVSAEYARLLPSPYHSADSRPGGVNVAITPHRIAARSGR